MLPNRIRQPGSQGVIMEWIADLYKIFRAPSLFGIILFQINQGGKAILISKTDYEPTSPLPPPTKKNTLSGSEGNRILWGV